jgi:hypothetical protein
VHDIGNYFPLFLLFEKTLHYNKQLMPIFNSVISPPLAKNFDKEIIFLHSFAAEEICSPATVA